MAAQRSFIVSYDIADPKRLRRVARLLEGYGYRLQESVFYCQLSELMKNGLMTALAELVNHHEDQCLLVDLGPNPEVLQSFETIGIPIAPIPKVIFV